MIELQIVSSKDQDVIGTKKFHKNMIYFGHKKGDILIDDDQIIDNHLMLEINEVGTFIHLNKPDEYFHLNGKRTRGVIKINANDKIKIGTTTFALTAALFIPELVKRDIINAKLNKMIEDDAPELEILSIVEKNLKDRIKN